MTRKAELAKHHDPSELKKRYLKSKDLIESRRWHLLWKVSVGWTIKESAILVGISYSYARKIVKQYNQQGEKSLKNRTRSPRKHSGGKKPLLNQQQKEKLAQALQKRPKDGGIWTGPKVARWIEEETGKEKVWEQRGWEYLKKLNYSWQRPRPKHKKGDEQAQAEFKKNLPQKVKEFRDKHPNAKVEVWFFDEHRVGLKPILRKVWAKKGQRPIAKVHHRYEWLYVYGFVNPKTGETLWYLIPRVNTEWLNLVYEQFAQDVGITEEKKILLIEDNASWHKSQTMEIPEGIEIEYLPPYSPELQPAERLWILVDEPLVNEDFETIEKVEEVLAFRCNYLREQMTENIKDLTNYHWFNY